LPLVPHHIYSNTRDEPATMPMVAHITRPQLRKRLHIGRSGTSQDRVCLPSQALLFTHLNSRNSSHISTLHTSQLFTHLNSSHISTLHTSQLFTHLNSSQSQRLQLFTHLNSLNSSTIPLLYSIPLKALPIVHR